jgi:nickel-type superoxide dismutase maturation protease
VVRLVETFVRRVVVEGLSMAPTYAPGERLTAIRRLRRVRVGDVVLASDPRDPERLLLKRCVARRGRALELRGDNAQASTDSRDFGPVAEGDVRWVLARSSWRAATDDR